MDEFKLFLFFLNLEKQIYFILFSLKLLIFIKLQYLLNKNPPILYFLLTRAKHIEYPQIFFILALI